jgi:hypothetical protein
VEQKFLPDGKWKKEALPARFVFGRGMDILKLE